MSDYLTKPPSVDSPLAVVSVGYTFEGAALGALNESRQPVCRRGSVMRTNTYVGVTLVFLVISTGKACAGVVVSTEICHQNSDNFGTMQCVDVPFIPNELTVDSANALNVEAGTGYQARAFAAATEGFNAITDTQQRPVSTASIVGFTSILTDSSDINGGGTYTSSVHGALHEQITFRNTSSERKSATVDWTLSGNETLATVRSHIDVSGVLFGEASSQSFYQYYERSHDFHGVAEIGDPLLSQTWEIDPHAFLTANVTAILDVSSGVDSYGLCGGGLFFQPCPSATAIADWGHTALFGLVLDPGIQWSADSPYFRPEVVVNSESGTGTVDEPPTAYLIAATLSVMAFGAGRAKK